MDDLFTLLILLFLSGFFSGAETALVSLSMGRVEGLLEQNKRGAAALYQLKQDSSRMLITILIGNNLVNIAASAIATILATKWLGAIGPGVAVGILTIVILIFGEITPKTMATRYAERISLAVAPILVLLMWFLTPLVWLFSHFTDWIQRLSGDQGDPLVTRSELINMVGHGEAEGTIEHEERKMIERVFAFNDLQAQDVMTIRHEVFSLQGARTVEEALPEILQQHYTRIPLYEESSDEISGVIYLRDLLIALTEDRKGESLQTLSSAPLFVPLNQPLDDLFSEMTTSNRQIVIVVDDDGLLVGVVSMEDLLEELVGEIYDEVDEVPLEVEKVSDEEQQAIFRMDGRTELRHLEKALGMELSGKPTDRVSYWILGYIERIPVSGERLQLEGVEVEIEQASVRRIESVRVWRQENH
ncbi:MAG: HlyC/CorC family transporter [Gammaproteobacteria bacterium]|jgi:CBS domain containing-hemolysin-like protein|nr:HlyC/CorC family transporter [Gammaproteobacteria bacterium]MBT3489833.1 HlyC/CorC family transporter [Gammaproteobacteria bacterium]MBT3718657.1 HlyC/CorC family transporter [Gammaproteobacteria bacterium]MBT3844729.1 HlyC/CorC family transporter [Gammaproteobacteria bacterium]MBT3893841.1 HlyC/CorC family transporter [Gammaproteobacteria bacterium]